MFSYFITTFVGHGDSLINKHPQLSLFDYHIPFFSLYCDCYEVFDTDKIFDLLLTQAVILLEDYFQLTPTVCRSKLLIFRKLFCYVLASERSKFRRDTNWGEEPPYHGNQIYFRKLHACADAESSGILCRDYSSCNTKVATPSDG